VSIIGIPLGLANLKLIPVSLAPFGRDIVDLDQARRRGLQPANVIPADPCRQSYPRPCAATLPESAIVIGYG